MTHYDWWPEIKPKTPFGQFLCWMVGHGEIREMRCTSREQFGAGMETTGYSAHTERQCIKCGASWIVDRSTYDPLTRREY
jgi:hypothetical protein